MLIAKITKHHEILVGQYISPIYIYTVQCIVHITFYFTQYMCVLCILCLLDNHSHVACYLCCWRIAAYVERSKLATYEGQLGCCQIELPIVHCVWCYIPGVLLSMRWMGTDTAWVLDSWSTEPSAMLSAFLAFCFRVCSLLCHILMLDKPSC